MNATIIDWYKLVKDTQFENYDLRCADVVLKDKGISFDRVEAFVEDRDSKEGGWKLAVENYE